MSITKAIVNPFRAIVLVLSVICAMVYGLVTPASSSALPPQGLYESCIPGTPQCLERLRTIKAGGFQLVLNYSLLHGSPQDLREYMDTASALGVELIWPLHDPVLRSSGLVEKRYRSLQPECGCKSSDEVIAYATTVASSHSSTWGYYIADEAPLSQKAQVEEISRQVRQGDARHPRLIVSYEQWWSNLGGLRPFQNAAEVLAADTYPIGTGAALSTVGTVSKQVGQLAKQHHKSPAMVLQAFSWSQHPEFGLHGPWPTSKQMTQMLLFAEQGEPQMILWYSFQDIQNSASPAVYWSRLVQAIETARAIEQRGSFPLEGK